MLTFSRMQMDHANSYYTTSNSSSYYSDGGVIVGTLFGNGAEELFRQYGGLEKHGNLKFGQNAKDRNLFHALLKGEVPIFDPETKEIIGFKEGAKNRKTGAYDFTFSAPKSVSLLYALAEERSESDQAARKLSRALKTAFKEANDIVVAHMQEKVLMNNFVDGKNQKVFNNQAIIAQFLHDDARRNKDGFVDPSLHCHNVFFNEVIAGYDENGQAIFKSIDNLALISMRNAYGQFFRNILKQKIKDLGIEIVETEIKNGTSFEIVLTDNEVEQREILDFFSSRKKEIDAEFKKQKKNPENKNKSEAQLRDEINQRIKRPKSDKYPRADWLKALSNRFEARFGNIDFEKFAEQPHETTFSRMAKEAKSFFKNFFSSSKEKETEEIKLKQQAALKNMKLRLFEILENQSRQSSLVQKGDLLTAVLMDGDLNFDLDEAEKYIDDFLKENCQVVGKTKEVYVSNIVIAEELEIQEKIEKLKNEQIKSSLLGADENIMHIEKIRNSGCSLEQLNLIDLIVRGKSKIACVQGDAGTGKSYAASLVKTVSEIYAERRRATNAAIASVKDSVPELNLMGMAFMGKTAKDLEDGTGIKSQTIAKFLLNWEKNGKEVNNDFNLVIIDEASMISAADARRLFEYIDLCPNTRCIFMGDVNQFSSVGRGTIFDQMQKAGVETTKLGNIRRQKTRESKVVVQRFKKGQINKMFDFAERRKIFEEVPNIDNLISKMVQDYTDKFKAGEEVIALSGTNAVRNELNRRIRDELFKDCPQYEKKRRISVPIDEISLVETPVFFERKGREYQIERIDGDTVHFINSKNVSTNIPLETLKNSNCQFYTKENVRIVENEKIIFTKNVTVDYVDEHGERTRKSIKNGELATITKIDGNKATLKFADKEMKIDLAKSGYFDYAYALTDYKSQGISVDNVLVYGDPNMVSSESFYVQITRVKENLKLYTTDFATFKTNLVSDLDLMAFENDPLSGLSEEQKANARRDAEAMQEFLNQNHDLNETLEDVVLDYFLSNSVSSSYEEIKNNEREIEEIFKYKEIYTDLNEKYKREYFLDRLEKVEKQFNFINSLKKQIQYLLPRFEKIKYKYWECIREHNRLIEEENRFRTETNKPEIPRVIGDRDFFDLIKKVEQLNEATKSPTHPDYITEIRVLRKKYSEEISNLKENKKELKQELETWEAEIESYEEWLATLHDRIRNEKIDKEEMDRQEMEENFKTDYSHLDEDDDNPSFGL